MALGENASLVNADNRPAAVIVGAGITGLTVAHDLARAGLRVAVVEKEDRPGGLARTFRYEGFSFDIGPHRFHSSVPAVDAFIREVLGNSLRETERVSKVRFQGQFYPWPIHPSYILLRFPPATALKILCDLSSLFRNDLPQNFEDYIVNLYGRTLYEQFFKGYTTKFLGVDPDATDALWAQTGIDRAIIDQRLKFNNLWQLIRGSVFPPANKELRFLYPAGGCEVFAVGLADRIRQLGGEILCNAPVESMDIDADRVTRIRAGGREWRPSVVIWTAPIHDFVRLIGRPLPDLRYRALVCYNFLLREGRAFPFQWSYHGSPRILFSRVSVPAAFIPGNTPPGRRSLCVEVACDEVDDLFLHPDSFLDRIVKDLKDEDLIADTKEILHVFPEKIPNAYPIYRKDFRSVLEKVDEDFSGISNLVRAGRQGLFWYNNMDHCIEAGMQLGERIRSGEIHPGEGKE